MPRKKQVLNKEQKARRAVLARLRYEAKMGRPVKPLVPPSPEELEKRRQRRKYMQRQRRIANGWTPRVVRTPEEARRAKQKLKNDRHKRLFNSCPVYTEDYKRKRREQKKRAHKRLYKVCPVYTEKCKRRKARANRNRWLALSDDERAAETAKFQALPKKANVSVSVRRARQKLKDPAKYARRRRRSRVAYNRAHPEKRLLHQQRKRARRKYGDFWETGLFTQAVIKRALEIQRIQKQDSSDQLTTRRGKRDNEGTKRAKTG